jgi:hypothetical protein
VCVLCLDRSFHLAGLFFVLSPSLSPERFLFLLVAHPGFTFVSVLGPPSSILFLR